MSKPKNPKNPEPPEHLSRRSRAFWRRISADYVLETHQLELLRHACEAMDVADRARAELEGSSLVVADRYGQLRPHPAVNIARDARLGLARLLRELNLDIGAEESRPPRIGGRDVES